MAARTPFALQVSDRWILAVTFAVLLASTTLLPLTQDSGYLIMSSVLVLILAVVTFVLRRFHIGDVAILGFQFLTLAGFSFAVSLGLEAGEGNPLVRYVRLFTDATNHMRMQPAPMEPNPGVRLLFVTAIGLIMILTDVMVQGIDRPMWSLAPLASLFLVPALALLEDVPWWTFVAIAVGYLAILLAEGINTSERWPRGVRRSEHDRGSTPLALRMALVVGVPAIVLTLGLGLVIPTLTSQGWGLTRPKGSGPLQMADPTLDLRRNLVQPQDRVVMTYTTDQPDGAYLRMASLPVFNATGWQNAGMQLTTGSNLPPAPGHRSAPGEVVRNTTIRVADFRSEYLPLPYAPDSFSADGTWSFDRDSLVVLASGENRTDAIRDLEYSVRSVDIKPDGPGLSRALAAGNPPDAQLTVPMPQDLPDDIINLTMQVTNGVEAPALKAAAIQNYLRNEGGYTYSTEPLPGSGYEALQNFLFRDKKGYCEQFAGAMATMARVAGIPSRVAVGFLPGERKGEQWEVSIRDMHAWPELWFEGYGWVRFEPTPTIASPPGWTVVSGSSENGQDGGSEAPAPTESVAPQEEPTPTAEATPEIGVPIGEEGFPWLRVLGVAGGAAVLAGLGATPMLLRSRRRNHRLDGHGPPTEQVENAWAEVRDSVVDFGGRWPAGSPRVIGSQLAHDLDAPAAKAMTVLSLMVERARYAKQHTINADLAAVTHQVRRGLSERSLRQDRIAATWWPRSFWHNLATRVLRT